MYILNDDDDNNNNNNTVPHIYVCGKAVSARGLQKRSETSAPQSTQ